MKFRELFTFFFIFFIISNLFSQEEIYLDENLNPITIVEYYEKTASFLYFKHKKVMDSITIHTVRQNYEFGKLSSSEMSQLHYLLNKNTNINLPLDKTIIINFNNLIEGYESIKTRSDSLAIVHEHKHKYSHYIYKSKRKRFDRSQKKCLKKFKNKNIHPLYFYRKNVDYTHPNKNVTWHKINPPIDALFFSNRDYTMLIIKPDGNYFYYHNIPEQSVNKLLTENWALFIKDYDVAKRNLLVKHNGFFNDIQKAFSSIVLGGLIDFSRYSNSVSRCYSHVSF